MHNLTEDYNKYYEKLSGWGSEGRSNTQSLEKLHGKERFELDLRE